MAWTVDIGGSDITTYCQSINWRCRWSRPSTVVINMPGHLYPVGVNGELHLYNNGQLKFSGPVWSVQATGQPNRTDVEVTAYDHLIYMTKRLCKQGLDDPEPFNLIEIWPTIQSWFSAPDIMRAFVQSALDDPNGSTGAPLPWIIGTTEFSNVDCTGFPQNTPMTLDQMRQTLLQSGQLAINVTPGIGASVLDFVVPPAGVGGAAASFGYQTGAFNSQNASHQADMDDMVNALWYLLGPRGPRPGIKINHWGGSITPTAPNAGGDGPDGEPGDQWPSELKNKFMGSRAVYGYFQEIRIFDEADDAQNIRPLYEEMWANEAWIRAAPRTFVSITPERGVDPTFTVGSFVGMSAGGRLNGGTSGTLLVFEFEVNINVNGITAITEIVASDNESGAPGVSR